MHFKHAAVVAVASMCALALVACGGNDSVATTPETDVTTPSTSTPSTTHTPSSTSTPPSTTTSTSSSSKKKKKKPTDPLTGKALSKNPVIAVKMDNTSFPQFGLSDADIIYTEQVEGGLTRLITIYHTEFPEEVGAVRSIRSTDMQLLPTYGKILLANSGGNTANLRSLRASILVSVPEGAPGIWRSSERRAPYNLHANLQKIAENHPDQPAAQSVGFTFDSKSPSGGREASDIDVTMIAGRTSFTYEDGAYQAAHGGEPYVDNDDQNVTVENVIVQHVSDKPDGSIDPIGNPSFLTSTVGSGDFTLYRDGQAIDGTWSRDNKTDPTSFLGEDDSPVALAPGKTWVVLAPQAATVNAG